MAHDLASTPQEKALRLFVAVDVPDAVKTALAAAVAPFRDRVPGARWTREGGWHVTLKFLGRTWPRLVPEVEAAVRAVAEASEPFDTRLTRIGAFPSEARARVLWAGLDGAAGAFDRIVRRLDGSLAESFGSEERAFAPHLTLARIAPPRRLSEFVPEILTTEVGSEAFSVDRLVLYRSRLSPRGAIYEAMLDVALGGGSDVRLAERPEGP